MRKIFVTIVTVILILSILLTGVIVFISDTPVATPVSLNHSYYFL